MMENVPEGVMSAIAVAVPMDRDAIRPTSTFEELAIDSLDVVNIVFELEESFDLRLPDDFKLFELTNVAAVSCAMEKFVNKHVSGHA